MDDAERQDKATTISLRLLAVLNTKSSTPPIPKGRGPSFARIVLATFSRTSPRHTREKCRLMIERGLIEIRGRTLTDSSLLAAATGQHIDGLEALGTLLHVELDF